MQGIALRLRRLRSDLGLSLREMANRLEEEGGYPVSHDSVRRYEQGKTVPAAYIAAVQGVFGVRVSWLLFGQGDPLEPVGDRAAPPRADSDTARGPPGVRPVSPKRERRIRQAWRSFVDDLDPEHPLRQVIIESWDQGEDDGEESTAETASHRVSELELKRRLGSSEPLLEATAAHLPWLTSFLKDLDHVVCLLNSEGIVLISRSSDELLVKRWALEPGTDWSEDTRGSSAIGRALATGKVVVVVGAERYEEAFHECACLAAPIRGPRNKLLGVLDVSTPLEAAAPERLAAVAYAARMIEREFEAG